MIVLIATNVHIISVIGTTAAATIAACATFARAHYRTEKYVRYAIRARLSKNAEPEFEKLARHLRDTSLSNYMPQSSHPSPEVRDALHEAEKRMGLRVGSTMPLVVPLQLILGVPHNCPSAAAMLYANRHPVVLIDDNLQHMLDIPEDFDRAFKIVVSVLCHELAHLIGWNTRWTRTVSIGELFATTAAMASLVAYGLENTFIFGMIGAVIATIYFASEPVLRNDEHQTSPTAVIARIALLAWVPYVIAGMIIGTLPVALTLGVTALALGLRVILASVRRREELLADSMAAQALGSATPLTDFFRTLTSAHPGLWASLFGTHPPIPLRIKNLRRIKL